MKLLKFNLLKSTSIKSPMPLFCLSVFLMLPLLNNEGSNLNFIPKDILKRNVEGEAPMFTLVNLQITAFLQGPYNSASNTMSDALRSGGLLPATDPYTESPNPIGTTAGAGVFAISDANNAIVDWVLLELRDASTPTTVLGSKSALIQRDGNIVSPDDGVSAVQFLSTDLNPASIPNSVFVVVKHRNHLGVRSTLALDTQTGTVTYNFTTSQTQAVGTNPMAALNAGNTVFGLWGGNVNGDTKVRYTDSVIPVFPSDAFGIYIALGGLSSGELLNVYNVNDVNMDRNVRYTDKFIPTIPSDAFLIFNFLAGNSAGQANQGF